MTFEDFRMLFVLQRELTDGELPILYILLTFITLADMKDYQWHKV